MNTIEFINTGIEFGDKVELTLESGKEVVGFFGGYKVEPDLNYIMPVFYAPKKDGTMGNRSAFGPDTSTNIPYSSIKTIKIC